MKRPEAEVTVGRQRTQAERLGQRQGPAIVAVGLPGVRPLAQRGAPA